MPLDSTQIPFQIQIGSWINLPKKCSLEEFACCRYLLLDTFLSGEKISFFIASTTLRVIYKFLQ